MTGATRRPTDLRGSAAALLPELVALRRVVQPGEEGDTGARVMVDEGVLDAAGTRPEAAYALHVASALLPHGFVGIRPGPILTAADALDVTVRGRGGHGSGPSTSRLRPAAVRRSRGR
ncbi:hypothetical protein ACFWOJ_24665 [Streptomyces sp. NPDC058439]|uniref:hypothetical protein n=1 Tax=Streptomyces sp. NPDC058439 TaxID=3346500 RepID=UPI00364ED955